MTRPGWISDPFPFGGSAALPASDDGAEVLDYLADLQLEAALEARHFGREG